MHQALSAVDPAFAAFIAHARAYLANLGAGLAKIPPSFPTPLPGGGASLGGVRPTKTSREEVRDAVMHCAPATAGFDIASAAQLSCWQQVAVTHVTELAQLRDRLLQLSNLHEEQMPPITATGNLAVLRKGQKQIIDADRIAVRNTDQILAEWERQFAAAYARIEGLANLERTFEEMAPQYGDDPEFIAEREDLRQMVLRMLNRVEFPFVDVSLFQVQKLREIVRLSEEQFAALSSGAGDYLAAYKETLEDYLRDVGGMGDEGLFGAILKGLLGASPGRNIAKFVVGGLLVAGAVGLGIYAVRKGLSAGTQRRPAASAA